MTGVAMVDYSVQPYQGTDIVAFVLALTGLLCLVIRWRDREPGMGWFALSMGSLSLWVATNELHLPSGPELNPSGWYLVMCLAQAAMAPGLVSYLGVPARLRYWTMLPVLLPSLAFALVAVWAMLTDAQVVRIWLHAFTALAFASMGTLALWAHRREPGAGHAWLGAALWTVPALAAVLVVTRADPVAIRYWAILPVMVVGMTLPSVSLLRRRRAQEAEIGRRQAAESTLEELNRSLEHAVAQRTADLQDMVAGLQSFNRNISHDLRGPLGGIAGLARIAAQGLAKGRTDQAATALAAIEQQADASARLVSSLLELARVGEVEPERQRVEPGTIAQEIVEQLRLTSPAPLPRIVIHPTPAVLADPGLLRAVLANLIGNAVKFTPPGGAGRIEIGCAPHDGDVCLYVDDNGVGFDAAAAASIFTPFSRLHGGEYEGHGVGLSIVRRAVDRMGGQVWAESQPGRGARFSFTLPALA
ncbi:MAG: HAMP domain-containing histidine kinase [Rubrivivax sp.]|nr:HAMP domain-containing histidine kinase [Rubrivivax sp.]